MIITRISSLSGEENSMEIPITKEEYNRFLNDKHRCPIQEIFPNLTPDQREFLMTGITSKEWDAMVKPYSYYKKDEEENDDNFIKHDMTPKEWSREFKQFEDFDKLKRKEENKSE